MNLRNVKYILRGELRRNNSMANIAADPHLADSCRDVACALGVALDVIDRAAGARRAITEGKNHENHLYC